MTRDRLIRHLCTYPGVTKALNELHAHGGTFAELRHIDNTSLVCLLK